MNSKLLSALRVGAAASLMLLPTVSFAGTYTVPEPATLGLVGLGLAAAAIAKIRKNKK